MHERYGVGAFANAGCYTLYGSIANISGDEDARNARFQKPGVAVERPAGRSLPVGHQIGTG